MNRIFKFRYINYLTFTDTLPWITSKNLWMSPKIGNWKRLHGENSDVEPIPISFWNETEALDEETSDSCIGELFRG